MTDRKLKYMAILIEIGGWCICICTVLFGDQE